MIEVSASISYVAVLDFLREEYGLKDGNLFDVHSLFYFLESKDEESGLTPWEKIQLPAGDTPEQVEVVDSPETAVFDLLVEKQYVILIVVRIWVLHLNKDLFDEVD